MSHGREARGHETQPLPEGRRAYRRPELREYGKVRELTSGGTGGGGDGASGMRQKDFPLL